MAVKKKAAKKVAKKPVKKVIKKIAKPKKPSQISVIKAMKAIRKFEDEIMAIELKIDKQLDIVDAYFG